VRELRQLVRQHRGELVAVERHGDEAEVHADEAAGQREGIHRAVAHEEDFPGKEALGVGVDVATRARRLHQRLPQRFHVGLQHRVVEPIGVAARLAHDLLAQAPLGAYAEILRGRLAQRRQPHLRGGRREKGGHHRHGGEHAGQRATPKWWTV